MAYVDAETPDGVRVTIERDPYVNHDEPILFDGELVELVGKEPLGLAMSRLRDGSTTTIHTARGKLIAHRRIGTEHYETLDGVRLLPVVRG